MDNIVLIIHGLYFNMVEHYNPFHVKKFLFRNYKYALRNIFRLLCKNTSFPPCFTSHFQFLRTLVFTESPAHIAC